MNPRKRIKLQVALAGVVGMVFGALIVAVAAWQAMPSMMLEVSPSRMGFEQTVASIEKAIVEQGWVHSGTKDMQKSLAKEGVNFPYRVKVIELCKPEYAQSVLQSDRYVASLMPCRIAVFEDDSGTVMISRMNTGLMGPLFGGNIADVMGDQVSRDERAILAGVIKG